MKKIMALLLFPCLNLLADTALDNLKEQLVQQQKIIKILQNKVSLIEKNNAQKQNIELEKKMALNTKDFSSSFSQKRLCARYIYDTKYVSCRQEFKK